MIVKKLLKQERIVKTEALLNRLPEGHLKWDDIKKELIRLQRGFKGERSVAYYLDHLPEKDFYIFHNLRLSNGKYYFQIDFLILAPHFAMILECKNFFGTLHFEKDFKQLIRTANGQEEGFSDPISQAKWHKHHLRRWLLEQGFPHFPIEFLVVISHPSTIVKITANYTEAQRYVVHNQIFLERIFELGRSYSKVSLDKKLLKKLSKKLLNGHVSEDIDILKRHGIPESDLMVGVQCPSCSAFGMVRLQGIWHCPKCHHKCKDAHQQSLAEYFLLISSSITNKQFRDFAQLSNEDSATYLLKLLNLPHTGSKKGRIYYDPSQE